MTDLQSVVIQQTAGLQVALQQGHDGCARATAMHIDDNTKSDTIRYTQ